MKVDVLDYAYDFHTYGMKSIFALGDRALLGPSRYEKDATQTYVAYARDAVTFDLHGAGITFTPDAMSGTVTSVTVTDGITHPLIRYSDLSIALGSPDWGDVKAMFGGDDVVLASSLSDTIYGLGGDDKLVGRGGPDIIYGGAGDDRIRGSGDSDQLFGDGGSDLIIGGGGADLMTGGGGRDSFRFSGTASDPVGDTIADFGRGKDRIELDRDGFSGLGAKGALDPSKFGVITKSGITNPDATILYDAWTSQLYYDRDGSGGKAMKLIATVFGNDPSTHVGADDIFVV